MKKVLITGGTGYIGSHTAIDLIANGFEVISIDNYSRSSSKTIERIEQITGKPFVARPSGESIQDIEARISSALNSLNE